MAEDSDSQATSAPVVVTEPTGSQTRVAMRLQGEDFLAVFRERIEIDAGALLHVSATQQIPSETAIERKVANDAWTETSLMHFLLGAQVSQKPLFTFLSGSAKV